MSRTGGPGLLFRSQNLDIHDDGPSLKKTNSNISALSQKKVGGNLGSRKALHDISNSGLGFHNEGSSVKKPRDVIPKTSQKKVGGSRKALQDLSNSLPARQEAAKKTKNLIREEHNVAEERCLHNSKQCTAARHAEMDHKNYDTIVFGNDLLHPDTSQRSKKSADFGPTPLKNLDLEPIPELHTSAETDWCPSPIRLDSPPSSASLYELPDLKKSVPREREVELTIPNQTLDTRLNGPAVTITTDSLSKASQNKVGGVLAIREPLQDILNSSSLCNMAATMNLTEEVPDFLDEGFLHDHSKCIAAHKAQMESNFYDAFLFDHGLSSPDALPKTKEAEAASDSSPMYLEYEEILELPMFSNVEWCPSPIHLDSPPFSPSRNNPNPEHHHFLSVPHFPCITSTPMMSDDDAEEPEDPKAVVAFSIPDLAPGMRKKMMLMTSLKGFYKQVRVKGPESYVTIQHKMSRCNTKRC
ncbi:hypothetical protein FRX31_020185 [Thalictrum thalictroides]|uniref:Uncharacterized protein n=1 Tax=Thalictrum thalictroides TaxID=46969 RepID=A0A7J6VYM7_THATH|nr:hypothetical protein FRX31_020185 [Thalictrum thalictroides]